MMRIKSQQAYDVKTFLSKKKKKTTPKMFTFPFNGMKAFWKIIITISFFIAFICLVVNSNSSVKGTVLFASPFLHSTGNCKKVNFQKTLILGTSSFIRLKRGFPGPYPKPQKAQPDTKITEQTVHTNGVEIKNETDYFVDVVAVLSEQPKFKKDSKVLIVHTHGSESYTPEGKYTYSHSGNYRTENKAYNVVRVGEELKKALESKCIQVIHDKTLNDYPSYNDSYNKTEKVIRSYIDSEADIAFVFDIHRDAVGNSDNIVKFTADIGGKTVAQVMTVCGSDVNLPNANWSKNFNLAVHIQNYFNVNYPGLLRPLNLRKERFNMHLSEGALLLEIGTNGNTLDEALGAARILGSGIGDFILQNS